MVKKNIEIKRIEKKEAREVCFSKRRSSLFKKASKLAILCGAKIAIVIFSLAGKPFPYGNPSFDSIVSHFHSGAVPCHPTEASKNQRGEGTLAKLHELNQVEIYLCNIKAQNEKLKMLQEAKQRECEGRVMRLLNTKVEKTGLEVEELFKLLKKQEGIIKEWENFANIKLPYSLGDQDVKPTTQLKRFLQSWDLKVVSMALLLSDGYMLPKICKVL